MKNKQSKKPTIYEIKDVCTNLIIRVEKLNNILFSLDSILAKYIEYKGDYVEFREFLDSQTKEKNESNKENIGESSRGDRKAKVSNIKSREPDKDIKA